MKHSFATRCLSALLAVLMLPLMTGCPGLISSIDVASQALTAAGGILTPVNAEYGPLLTQGGQDLAKIGQLVDQYDKAVAADKPGIASQIKEIVAALSQNLSTVLQIVHVKNPQLAAEIGVGVGIATAVLNVVLSHLPKTKGLTASQDSHTRSVFGSLKAKAPEIKFKNANDLKKAWNDAVNQSHPEAVIR